MVDRRTALEVRPGIDTLVCPDALAVGTRSSAGREPSIAGSPLLPRVVRVSPDLRGRAWAVHGVGTDTVADLVGGTAHAVVSGSGEAVGAAKAARVVVEALRERIVRIIALLPNAKLGRTVSRATPSMIW